MTERQPADSDTNADADANVDPVGDVATRVALAFSPADDQDVADGIEAPSFRAYLTKAHHGPVTLGDEWDEFVACGCGSTKDVTFEVRSITGDAVIGEETAIEYEAASN